MPEADFYLKLGDTNSVISTTVLNSGGTAVDIQNALVRWKMRPLAGGTVSINAAATNAQSGVGGTANATTGMVSYSWGTVPSETGRFLGEWEVAYSAGGTQSFPNDGYVIVDVMEDIR